MKYTLPTHITAITHTSLPIQNYQTSPTTTQPLYLYMHTAEARRAKNGRDGNALSKRVVRVVGESYIPDKGWNVQNPSTLLVSVLLHRDIATDNTHARQGRSPRG